MARNPTESVPLQEQLRLAATGGHRLRDLLGGRYSVDTEVGRGAFGIVYRGREADTGALVAIKICSAGDERRRARLRREVEALRRVAHEGVARVRDFIEGEALACLVADFIQGEPLSALVERRGRLPAAEALDLLGRLLSALSALHEQGIQHRDVKPENIIIRGAGGTDPGLVLVDLGLARGPEDLTLTAEGDLIGTPAYMPPEQADDPGRADHRADLYSAAAVLFFMIEGRPPFEGKSLGRLLVQHRTAEIPGPTRGTALERAELMRLLARGLAKEPSRRWPSAAAAMREVDLAAGRLEDPGAARRAGAWLALAGRGLAGRGDRSRRWRWAIAGAALAVVAVAAVSVAGWRTFRTAVPSPANGEVPAAPGGGSPPVDRAELRGNRLVALDAAGDTLWSFDPGGEIDTGLYRTGSGLITVADLTGDGVEEVLFGATQRRPEVTPSRWHLLDRAGRELWALEAGREITSPDNFVERNWDLAKALLLPAAPGGRRDMILISKANKWSPTQVMRVSPEGRVLGEWWNHGVMGHAAIHDVDRDGRVELILTGYYNTYGAGAMAILDPSRLHGMSPPGENGRFVFAGLGPGSQLAYVRFDKNEIAAILSRLNAVERIETPAQGGVGIRTGSQECHTHYEFDHELRLERSFVSTMCGGSHREYEARGVLDHPFRPDEPGLLPPPLYWTGSSWSEEPVWTAGEEA